ncbi:formin-like protein (DUF1005) [Wolffia australiana]
MDPCHFVRIIVGNLALKIPVASKPARSGVHPSSSPCYCKIRLAGLPSQTAVVPLVPPESAFSGDQPMSVAASFDLSGADLERLAAKPIILTAKIYTGCRGATCGVNSGRLLGRVSVQLDVKGAEARPWLFHNGWISVGKEGQKSPPHAQLHLAARADPDPRFVFEFGADPECSPQVFQLQGSMRQPVFTCAFSCRNADDRFQRTRSTQTDPSCSRSWLGSFGSDRERAKERKGWSVTVHDLSGSPVALASMVTPFVPSPGSDKVSRANPGAWLVLRPGDGTWKPWGRLEAWRERGDGLGLRFELLPDPSVGSAGAMIGESTVSSAKGGKFCIDLAGCGGGGRAASPAGSPPGSGDYGYLVSPFHSSRGFVMSSTVQGERSKSSRPTVEVGVQHVGCAEDAAAFVALAAAIDLSMDACRLFSCRLRKELGRQQDQS